MKEEDIGFVRVCPRCKSTMVRDRFDSDIKRMISRCLNCLHKGDELFPKSPLRLIRARTEIRNRR